MLVVNSLRQVLLQLLPLRSPHSRLPNQNKFSGFLESYKAVFQLYVYHTFISNLLMSSFLFLFQGAYGNPGEPGPSGDPVRLLIAVSVFGYS